MIRLFDWLVEKLILSIVPERDCSICDDPNLPLKEGTNLVFVCLQIGGHVIKLDLTVENVKKYYPPIGEMLSLTK